MGHHIYISAMDNQCNHCQQTLTSPYCGQCGHPADVVRIDGKYIRSELASVFLLEKGFFYTTKELLLRPGKSIREFLSHDRKRLVKPIIFTLICSLIYSLSEKVLGFEDGYVNVEGEIPSNTLGNMLSWIQANYGYSNLMMAILIVLWVKLMFWKSKYNGYEIFILICFLMGVSMLMYTILGAFSLLAGPWILTTGAILGVIYCAIGIASFYDKGRFVNYVKGFFAYFLGMATFFLVVALIGVSIDSLG